MYSALLCSFLPVQSSPFVCDECLKQMPSVGEDGGGRRRGGGEGGFVKPVQSSAGSAPLKESLCNCAACVNKRYIHVVQCSVVTWLKTHEIHKPHTLVHVYKLQYTCSLSKTTKQARVLLGYCSKFCEF